MPRESLFAEMPRPCDASDTRAADAPSMEMDEKTHQTHEPHRMGSHRDERNRDIMKPLSGLDALFVYAETPTTPMNVIATIVIDPRIPARSGKPKQRLDYEALIARLEARLPRLPHFRRKLLETPFGLGHPVWVEAEDFALDQHVMRVLAREPGGREELAEVVAKAASMRLDRARPLWTIWVVEGLERGRVALIVRSHHALLDGMSGAALLLHLFDLDEDDEDEGDPGSDSRLSRLTGERPCGRRGARSAAAGVPGYARDPLPLWVLTRAALALPMRTTQMVEGVTAAAAALLRVTYRARTKGWGPGKPVSPLATTRPAVFNRAVSSRRAVAYARIPVARVAEIRMKLGGTLNDVVLAGCATALFQHSLERGDRRDEPLIAAVPISTRSARHEPGGNRISAMLVRLPMGIEDPIEGLLAVIAETRLAKRFHKDLGRHTIAAIAELAPPRLTARAMQLYSRLGLAQRQRPIANLTISCVTGPGERLRMGGAPVEALHPHGPLFDGSGLNITVMRYAGSIDVGVLACPVAVPDPAALADAIAAAIEHRASRSTRSEPVLAGLVGGFEG